MDAVILAAGFGTRLGCRPKAFLPVGGTTALDLCAKALDSAGVGRALVVHNARWSASFDRWRRNRAETRMEVETLNDGAVDPDSRLGAVGDLRLGLEALGRADAVILAVDTVFTWPLRDFLERAGGADPALATRSMRRGYEGLGGVDVDAQGVVRNFYDGRRPGGRAWAGRVWLGPATIPQDTCGAVSEHCAEEQAAGRMADNLGAFFGWLSRRRTVRAYPMDEGEAWDVGTPCGLASAQEALGP